MNEEPADYPYCCWSHRWRWNLFKAGARLALGERRSKLVSERALVRIRNSKRLYDAGMIDKA